MSVPACPRHLLLLTVAARCPVRQPRPATARPAWLDQPARADRAAAPVPPSLSPPCSSGGGDSVSQFAIEGIELKVRTNPPPAKQFYQQNSQTQSAPGDPLGLTTTNAGIFRGLPPGPISLQQPPGNVSLASGGGLDWRGGGRREDDCRAVRLAGRRRMAARAPPLLSPSVVFRPCLLAGDHSDPHLALLGLPHAEHRAAGELK